MRVVAALIALLAMTAAFAAQSASAATLSVTSQLISDGTAPTKDAGTVGSFDPGDDDSLNNNVVRTLDTVTYRVDWSLNDPDGTTPLLKFSLPEGYIFKNNPGAANCPGGISQSTAGGITTLTCNQGVYALPADSITRQANLLIGVPASKPNGDQFGLTVDLDDANSSHHVPPTPATTVKVSASPAVNLFKGGCTENHSCGGGVLQKTNVPGYGIGFTYDYVVGLRGTQGADNRGISQITEPITFWDDVRIPLGDGTDGHFTYPVGPGMPGLKLMSCDRSGAYGEEWPGVRSDPSSNYGGGLIDNFVRQLQVAPTCTQQDNEKGKPVKITLAGFEWDRAFPAPTHAASNSDSFGPSYSGIIGYARIHYFLSYEDWKQIRDDRSSDPDNGDFVLPDGSIRNVGQVRLGDRLVGPDASGNNPLLPDDVGACTAAVTTTATGGWVDADSNIAAPSSWDPVDIGGVSNLLALFEPSSDNGACDENSVDPLQPTTSDFGAQKYAIALDTNPGPYVAPGARVQTGLQFALNTVLRAPSDVTDPARSFTAGSALCDKWDNSKFGPNPDTNGNWITPVTIGGAGGPGGGIQDYNQEYGPDGIDVEYAMGKWGTHGDSIGKGFYWQGRSRCEDTATPFVSGANPGSNLIPFPGGDYWVTADKIDFHNSNAPGTVANIDDVNAVRVTLKHPLPPMFPSEIAARTNDLDASNDIGKILDTNPVARNTRAQYKLDWRDRPGLVPPQQFRNYATWLSGSGGSLSWAQPAAIGTNDTTQTASVNPNPGNNVSNSNAFSKWWEMVNGDLAVAKSVVNELPSYDPGEPITYRLITRGVPTVGLPADAEGSTDNVVIEDVLQNKLEYIPGTVVSSGNLNIGEPQVFYNNRGTPQTGTTTLRWTLPTIAWTQANETADFDITFQAQIGEQFPPQAGNLRNQMYAFTPDINFPGGEDGGNAFPGSHEERTSFADIASSPPAQGGSSAILNKSVSPQQLRRNTPFTYSLTYANYSSTPIATFDAIDILPFIGDHDATDPNPLHSRNSHYNAGAITFTGVTGSGHGEQVWVTSVDPDTLDALDTAGEGQPRGHANADNDAYLNPDYATPSTQDLFSGAGTLPSTQWPCLIAQVGTPACPSITSLSQVTALRFVGKPSGAGGTTPFLAAGTGPFNIQVKYTTTGLAEPGDLYDNSWVANFGDLLPVYRPIKVPPTSAIPQFEIAKKSSLSPNGPWTTDLEIPNNAPVYFQISVTNTGQFPLLNLDFADPLNPACDTPSATPPDELAPGQTFTYVCSDPNPKAPPHPNGYANTVTICANDDDFRDPNDDTTGNAACFTSPPSNVIVLPPSVSVGDFVWRDLDHDGIQDAGDPGIQGVTVTLTGPDGNAVTDVAGDLVGPATTDASGKYLFNNLPLLTAGQHYTTHVVQAGQAPLVGLQPTLATVGANRAVDSSTVDSESIAPLTTNGDQDLTLDFGFVVPEVSVGDFVWKDLNGNGLQDPGEPGIPNVRVTIQRRATGGGVAAVDDVYGNDVNAVFTDANGHYEFDHLPVLTGSSASNWYQTLVDNSQVALVGLSPTLAGQGADRAIDSAQATGQTAGVALATSVNTDLTLDGQADPKLDFGYVAAVSVGDFVWIDQDVDGIQDPGTLADPGEPGVQGVQLTITAPGGGPVTDVFGNPVGPATTNASGLYRFTNLPPIPAGQSYTVHIDNSQAALAALGLVPTIAHAGTNHAVDSETSQAASEADLHLGGTQDLTLDFGFVGSVSVGNYVWKDNDRDGTQGPAASEPGIPGVKLTLTGPGGVPVTDVLGNPVGPQITDANGFYQFTKLPPLQGGASYKVTLDPSTVPAGLAPTRPNTGTDPTTDSSLGSEFSGALGDPGDTDQTLDFGFVDVVSVGDYVWNDKNRNGIQGTPATEPGIPGVQVTITGPGGGPVNDATTGLPVGPATTDVNGKYLFSNLPTLTAGQSYTTHVDNSQAPLAGAGLAPTITGAGTHATDSETSNASSEADLSTGGASDLTLDYGFVQSKVSVGDFVWRDDNRDGDQDGGEPGIQGITVTLTGPGGGAVTDVTGALVGPATTNANGLYLFDNLPVLPAGQHYTTHINNNQAALISAGLVPTITGGGTPSTDSSLSNAESGNLTVNDASDLTLDFGFVFGGVTVGDFVWRDINFNGIQDSGDPGIAGVTVTLTGPTGGPVTDVSGNPVGPTVTDANGKYLFEHLPILNPGQSYTARINNAQAPLAGASLVPTKALQGTNRAVDSSTSSAASTGLTVGGQQDLTLDFGFVGVVSVGDYVWRDDNRDGIQGTPSAEPPIPGVVVTLVGPGGGAVTNVDGAVVGPATTDANGLYQFTRLPTLPAGQTYTTRIDNNQPLLVEKGYHPTLAGVGTNRAVDSSNGSAVTVANMAVPGTNDPSLDFGFIDDTPAACNLTKTGTDALLRNWMTITTFDKGSGVKTIEVVQNKNAQISISPSNFPVGYTDPISVRGNGIVPVSPTQFTIKVTDVAGNIVQCDPIAALSLNLLGQSLTQTYTIPQAERYVYINNGTLGASSVKLVVNGTTTFNVTNLKDDENRRVDIGSAMRPGNNSLQITSTGRPLSTVLITTADI